MGEIVQLGEEPPWVTRIRELCHRLEVNPRALGLSVGRSASYVPNLGRDPGVAGILEVAHALGESVGTLVGEEPSWVVVPAALLNSWAKLAASQRAVPFKNLISAMQLGLPIRRSTLKEGDWRTLLYLLDSEPELLRNIRTEEALLLLFQLKTEEARLWAGIDAIAPPSEDDGSVGIPSQTRRRRKPRPAP